MEEAFLHYIWQTLNFDLRELETTKGEAVYINRPGLLNHDQGPDFSQAKLRIGYIDWVGWVEIHLETKDWYRHHHECDPAYNGVILHVVGKSSGAPVRRQDGTIIPEISLEGRIPERIAKHFTSLSHSAETIPCGTMIGSVKPIYRNSWIDRLAVERIEMKANRISNRLEEVTSDWEQVIWEEIAASIGGRVNADPFRRLARLIPAKIIRKHSGSMEEMEALLFGAAGLLRSSTKTDSYFVQLQSSWRFLSAKFQLKYADLNFRYLRMRPASFPTVRISQLANLVHHFPALCELLLPDHIERLLSTKVLASSYWDRHYRFFEESPETRKALGRSLKESILINTLVPLACLYFRSHGNQDKIQGIVGRLNGIRPEKNKITRLFQSLGISAKNALETQGLIQLKNHYCQQKKCLTCGIGHQILKTPDKKWNSIPSLLSAPARKPE